MSELSKLRDEIAEMKELLVNIHELLAAGAPTGAAPGRLVIRRAAQEFLNGNIKPLKALGKRSLKIAGGHGNG
jgi:hypothetical protein